MVITNSAYSSNEEPPLEGGNGGIESSIGSKLKHYEKI